MTTTRNLRTLGWSLLLLAAIPRLDGADGQLQLTLRSRVMAKGNPAAEYKVVEKQVVWDAKNTALIICDMWDDHWCKSAARRVAELAGPMNDAVKAARNQGVLIIHAPSSVVDFYRDTAQRKQAQTAP